MSISVRNDGSVITVKPFRVSLDRFLNILKEKFSWIEESLRKIEGRTSLIYTRHSKAESVRLRNLAREIVIDRIVHFNQFYQFDYKRIFIKNQKTRWGSCSSRGNLNFNYRIALLSPELQDYLVVHELCHLKEFNHSKKFWKLVERQIPNYRELNKMLK